MRFWIGAALALGALGCKGSGPTPSRPNDARPGPVRAVPAAEVEPAQEEIQVGCCRALVFRPLGALRNERLPLVVALHGLGDRAEGFADLVQALPLRVRVVVLDGVDPWPGGGGGRQWFPMGSAEAEPAGFVRGVDAVAGALGALTRRYPTCGLPVVTGFSQGAMLAYALAGKRQAVVAGVVPIAGRLPALHVPTPGTSTGSPVRVRGLHGDADPRISLADGQAAVEGLRAAGLDARMQVFPGVGHGIPGPVRAAMVAALSEMARCP